MSHKPLIGSNGTAKYITAPGIASVEVVFNPSLPQDPSTEWLSFGEQTRGADIAAKRLEMVAEAEKWERESRAKKQRSRSSAAPVTPATEAAALA